ncbi:MAG: glycosyltransferase family 39 protein [Endomicrobiia bacterium]
MKAKQKNNNLKSRVSFWVIFLGFMIWVYLIFIKSRYFNYMPLPFTTTGLLKNFIFLFDFNKFKLLFGSLLVAFLIILSCLGYGIFVCKLFRLLNKKLILNLILGCGVFALIIFMCGLVGLIYKFTFLLLVIIGLIIAIIHTHKIFIKEKIFFPKFNFFEIILFFIFLCAVFINLLGALTPETFFDSQFYLLGLLNQWKLQHKITFNPYIFSSLYPFNINMLYLVGLELNNDITAKLMHWSFGIISCLLLYAFLKQYFSNTTVLLSIIIFYTVPTVMAVSWKTAIELGITMFDTAMVLCMLEYFIKKEKFWLVLSGVFGGFALGSKYLSLLECFSICIVFFIFKLILEKDRFFITLKTFLYFLFPLVLIASPWYLRNLILTGNPIFPFFAHKIGLIKPRIIGNIFADPPHPEFSFKNYFLFLWPLTLGQLQQESYPGGVFLTFFPLLFIFKNIDKKIKFLSMYVLMCLLLWIPLGRFYLRYFIPVLPVVGILYGYFISENNFPKMLKNIIYLSLLFIVISNMNFAMRILHVTQTPSQFVFTDMSIKEYLSTQRPSYPCPYYQVADWINKNLSKDSTILLLGETRGLFFKRKFFTHGVLEYSPLLEMLKKIKTPEELYEEFKKKNITHILLNVPEAKRLAGYDNFYFEQEEFKIWCKFWNKYIKEIYRDIADIALPERGIYSMKKQLPQWWQQYSSDPANYVYLYEIIPKDQAENKKHKPPYNFFLHKELYSQERWEKIKNVVEEIIKDNN